MPGVIAVTGANGHLGQRLLQRLTAAGASGSRALVRSESARDTVLGAPDLRAGERTDERAAIDAVIVDYRRAETLEGALAGVDAIVHLTGIIKETSRSTYVDAHENTCAALAAAASAAGVSRVVYISIVGSRPDSPNACLSSKGRAEEILLSSSLACTVLRVPMVLGPGDIASRALRGQALGSVVPLVAGGRTLQQPIDAGDVVEAVMAALALTDPRDEVLDLGGPECLSQRALVERVADLHGRRPRFVSIPLGVIRAVAMLMESAMADPPLTRAMLEVLQHDDHVDSTSACARLELELTPLDDTLRRCVGPETV